MSSFKEQITLGRCMEIHPDCPVVVNERVRYAPKRFGSAAILDHTIGYWDYRPAVEVVREEDYVVLSPRGGRILETYFGSTTTTSLEKGHHDPAPYRRISPKKAASLAQRGVRIPSNHDSDIGL